MHGKSIIYLPLYSDSIRGIETSDLHLFREVDRVILGSGSKKDIYDLKQFARFVTSIKINHNTKL